MGVGSRLFLSYGRLLRVLREAVASDGNEENEERRKGKEEAEERLNVRRGVRLC